MAQQKWLDQYGPWAVVTGASSGIGRELAIGLAQRGSNVVLSARRKHLLDALAQELSDSFDIKTRVIDGDLSDEAANRRLFDETGDLNVGLLVANAGFGSAGAFVDQNIDNELNMIDLNCRSVALQAHEFAQRFRARNNGGIIFLSSILSGQGVPQAANYAATKAYIQSLAEGLYAELQPLGIHVLATSPAPVNSQFGDRANMRIKGGADPKVVANNTLKALGHKHRVQPHFMSQFLTMALSTLPRFMRIKIMTAVMSGMVKK
jgi:short-subunit dehydrogenase